MSLRALLMAAVVAFTCFLSFNFSEHHEGTNEKAFELLYMHVLPAPLVSHGDHGAHGDGHSLPGRGEHSDDHGHDDHGDDHGAAGHSSGGHGAGGHGAVDALVAIPLPGFLSVLDGDRDPSNGAQLVLMNLQLFQIAAVILIFIAFSGVPAHLRGIGRGDVVTRTLAGFCMYIRDEMAVPVMGRETADRFMPLFFSLFFFIAFANLMGLVPGSATATASIYVTAGLALITFGTMIGAGMAIQGPGAFWKNLVPHVPGWLWPLMFVVEVLGLLVKPAALMIRLFANLTGGHLVVLSFMGLIFFFAGNEKSATGFGVAPIAVAFAAFIMIIEAFVALLQAYIFTQLSILFVGASVHPEH